MSKTQIDQLKTLTAKSLKLIKQFLLDYYQQFKQVSQLDDKVIENDDLLSLPNIIQEYQTNTSQLQSSLDTLNQNIQPLLNLMTELYADINTSSYFHQKLQQDTLTLEYLLSIPNRINIIQSYINVISNTITNKQYSNNISNKIEMINNMITNTQYEFNVK